MRLFPRHRDTRILDGSLERGELSESDAQVAKLFDDLRALRAPVDPRTKVETVRKMKNIIDEPAEERTRRTGQVGRFTARVAIVAAAIVLAGTATAAIDATPASVPGVTGAPGSVAKAVLASLGIQQRTDEEDAAADEADRQKDDAERTAEGAGPLQSGDDVDADLPEPAKQGIATAKKNAENALTFSTAMRTWATCVGAAARKHGEANDAKPESERTDFDSVKACGDKPTKPAGMGDEEDETESEAAKEDSGPPASVGRPSQAGPPASAGPPKSTGPNASGRSSSTGNATKPGPPPNAGPPEGAGRPPNAGPPKGAGPGGGGSDDEDEEDDEDENENDD